MDSQTPPERLDEPPSPLPPPTHSAESFIPSDPSLRIPVPSAPSHRPAVLAHERTASPNTSYLSSLARAPAELPLHMSSKPATPRPRSNEEPLAMPQRISEAGRPLNVTDALSYLDAVKIQFQDKPDVYNHFLDIMKDFKSEVIDTPGVIERVSMLFHGNRDLIQGFNTFLPPGYRIETSADPRDPNLITVTTPTGTTIQNTTTFGQYTRLNREGAGKPGTVAYVHGGQPPLHPSPRSATPYQAPTGHPSHEIPLGYHAALTTDAASLLGNLNGKTAQENKSAGEFNHAIQYLNKIKAHYSDDPDTYKQFLEILQTYQKEQRHLQDSQVYVQVQMLFKDAPELLAEFKDFLPEVTNAIAGPVGVVGILPHPATGPGMAIPWSQPESGPSNDKQDRSAKRPTVAAKRKRRGVAEKELTPVPPAKVSAGNRSKRSKINHKPAEPESPPYPTYGLPASPPQMHPTMHPQSHIVSAPTTQAQSASLLAMPVPVDPAEQAGSKDNLVFLERAKAMLEHQKIYDEFLKLLNLYSKDIIDPKTLIEMAQAFLGEGDMLTQFKDVVGLGEQLEGIDYGPPGSIRTGPPDPGPGLPAFKGEGPSYRKTPESELRLACSGRDELCHSVLNDEWASHPTWASEDNTYFTTHKKNSFEEAMHRSEEERHEYWVQLEGLSRLLSLLEPLNARIEDMTNDERAGFRLRPDFGGPSKGIYYRILKKVYGNSSNEVIHALQECPSIAVPVVLTRLKLKDEEWRRAQREWAGAWREIDSKNFYKSLDYQLGNGKGDRKTSPVKQAVAAIENLKTEQKRAYDKQGQPSFAFAPDYQLKLEFHDVSLMQDALRLIYAFVEHSPAQYSPQERRAIESFLQAFIDLLCYMPSAEQPASGRRVMPLQDDPQNAKRDHVSGGRPGLTKQATATDGLKQPSDTSRAATPPTAKPTDGGASIFGSSNELDEVWVTESFNHLEINPLEDASRRRPFFANTTFYALLSFFQSLYSKLLVCKEAGAALIARKLSPLRPNAIAVELGLDDPNGPLAVLSQYAGTSIDEIPCDRNLVYEYLLGAIEKTFENEASLPLVEEHTRWFVGPKAYQLFNLDKSMALLVKQIQTVLGENRCQDLWALLQETRKAESISNQDTVRYRREAEKHVGSDEHLYRIDWDHDEKVMLVHLVESHEPSTVGDGSATSRWREYVDSYILRQPTEWLPRRQTKAQPGGSVLFLRRHLTADETPSTEGSWADLRVRISLGTYKLFYEAGSEDVLVTRRDEEEERELRERARVREAERRKCRWLSD